MAESIGSEIAGFDTHDTMVRIIPTDPFTETLRAARRVVAVGVSGRRFVAIGISGRRFDRVTAASVAVVIATLVVLGGMVAPVAATGVSVDEVSVTPETGDAGETETHQFAVSASGLGDEATVTLTLPDELAGASDGAVVGGGDVEINGGTVEGEPELSGGEIAVEFAVDDGVGEAAVSVDVEVAHPTVATDHDVAVTVESDGESANSTEKTAFETTRSVSYLVDGAEQSPVALGQPVTAVGLEPSTDYNLRVTTGDDSEFVDGVTAGEDGNLTIDTGEADETGNLFLSEPGEQEPIGDGFEVVAHEIDAGFGVETVDDAGDGSTTEFTVGSNVGDAQFPADVSVTNGLTAEELFRVFTGGESPDGVPRDAHPDDVDDATTTVGPSGFEVAMYDSSVEDADSRIALLGGGGDGGTVDFEDRQTTAYDFEIRALDTGATADASVTVTEAELDGSFGREEYRSPAGDLVEISVNLGAADSGYVLVGGDRLSDPDVPTGYFDVLYVDGDATITVNTRLVGTNVSTDAAYESDATVVSYAHEYGASTPAAETDTFAELTFEDAAGEAIADDLASFRGAAGTGSLPGPLVPQRYRLTVGAGDTIILRDDGVVEPDRAFDRSHLILTEPELREEIELFTTLGGSASGAASIEDLRDAGLERDAVTKGDRLVFGFEATGIWGALTHLSDRETVFGGESGAAPLNDLLAVEEGVTLTVRQTNPGRNERRTELDLGSASTGDAYLFYEGAETFDDLGDGPTAGTIYLVLDTRDGTGFTDDISPGDEFEVEFGFEGSEGDRYRYADVGGEQPAPFAAKSAFDDRIDEQFPYWGVDDGGVSVTRTVTIQERTLEYDRITDAGELLVRPTAEASITGQTTLLPATALTAEFVSDAGPTPSVETNAVDIDEDGNFSVGADFSGIEPGSRVNVELYDAGELYDSRSIVVVEDPDDPFTLAVDQTTTNLTVTRGETLRNLTVTVRNDGAIEGRAPLTIDVGDGALVDSRTVRVRADRERNVSFSRMTADIDPGEYEYVAEIDGDTETGTLVVEPDPDASDADEAADEPNAEEADSTDESDDEGDAADGGAGAENETDGDDEREPEETTSPTLLPFGIGTRETVGGTVLVGATYLLGHWV